MTKENQLNLLQDSAYIASSFSFPQELPVHPNPLKLCKWYASEINTISDQIDLLEKKHNCTCTCSKGCSACCQQLIVITNLEYRIIEFAVNNLPLDERIRMKETVIKQCDFLTQHGYSSKTFSSCFISAEKNLVLQQEFFSFNLPCPLLNKDNSCSIYTYRPTLCWSYRNYGEPDQCKQTFDVPTTIKYDDWESRVTQQFIQIKKPSFRNSLQLLQFALFSILTQSRF